MKALGSSAFRLGTSRAETAAAGALCVAGHKCANPRTGNWTKCDTSTGRFMDQTTSGGRFEGVRRERERVLIQKPQRRARRRRIVEARVRVVWIVSRDCGIAANPWSRVTMSRRPAAPKDAA